MEKHLDLHVTLQRGLIVLLLWAFVLQAVVAQKPPLFGAHLNPITITPPTVPPLTCHSIEVRTVKDLASLQNCTRVLGHVWLAYSQLTPNDVDALKFASAVEEISDYLLVHRAHGLESLMHIFPKLKIIRGRQLLFDEFALVVYENRDLRELGLKSLIRIQAGNIRIEVNPNLCYLNTVDWVQLLGNSTTQYFDIKFNREFNECPHCDRTRNDVSEPENIPDKLRKHCWSFGVRQERPPTINAINCLSECGVRGCDSNGVCCDHNCLSDCYGANCSFCANLRIDQRCVDVCPEDHYKYEERECLTAAKCRQLGWIPHGDTCMEICPKNHFNDIDSQGHIYCKQKCSGKYIIHTMEDFESLEGCITIFGSLTIELNDIKIKIPDLENALSSITEITGYLKVVNSAQLMSLHFLRNLFTIGGEELIDDLYAFYVVGNYHLTGIWMPNQKVAILKGSIYFHLNPHLCPNKIRMLRKSLKNARPLTTVNISPHSNGELVVCSNPIILNVTVEDVNATAARVKVDPFIRDNIQVILGYVYYYRKAPVKNISFYDGRHGCGHDNWHMNTNPTRNVRHIFANLKAYTQYAYYVEIITMAKYHMQLNAYSKIQYFRTLPNRPGPLRKIYYTVLSEDQISLHWWPPRLPNGLIEKYIIEAEKVFPFDANVSNSTIAGSVHIEDPLRTCECILMDPEQTGPVPSEDNYYHREELIFEETLPNLLFVTKFIENRHIRDVCNGGPDCIEDTPPTTPNTMEAAIQPAVRSVRSVRQASENADETPGKQNSLEENTQKDGSESTEDPNFVAAIRRFNKYQEEQEQKVLRMQDTGPDNFPIIHPKSVCPMPYPTAEYILQNNCTAKEHFEGIVVPGHINSYVIGGLMPDQAYRITMRACAADLANGCGSKVSIFAETLTRSVVRMMNDLETNATD